MLTGNKNEHSLNKMKEKKNKNKRRYVSNACGFHPCFSLHCGVIGTAP